MTDVNRLAELAGIESAWWDFFGQKREVPLSTKQAFLSAMGFDLSSDEAIAKAVDDLENGPWRQWLAPVTVMDEGGELAFEVTLPWTLDTQSLHWQVWDELDLPHEGTFRPDTLEWRSERVVDGVFTKRWCLRLPVVASPGYYRVKLSAGGQSAQSTLIVAPREAFVQDGLKSGPGRFGIATQIYALRNDQDWGMGNFGTLKELAQGAAELGASSIGINPLHALYSFAPEKFSPYSPSSRLWLNMAYLDYENIPEFKDSRAAKRLYASPGFQATLARVRSYPLVAYQDVAQLARPLLEVLFKDFKQDHLAADDDRANAFHAFVRQGGKALHQFALFEVLYEHFTREGTPYWRHWPQDFQDPNHPMVASFDQKNADRVMFFKWVQFICDEQVKDAHQAGLKAGADIGLYRDLAVGIAGDGADAWGNQAVLANNVAIGAPPDPLALKGQNWGLVPFNPLALRDQAYGPFIQMIRANMRHAGAMRLDHAMSLERLYWVPPYVDADEGAYVRYPVGDLFRILALESRRNRCLVIGEDLGNVPAGFRERMAAAKLFTYRVALFEKQGDQFKTPDQYDTWSLAMAATHDLPSLRGYWNELDLDAKEKLDLFPTPETAPQERFARAQDRRALVAALKDRGLVPDDFPADGALDEDQGQILARGLHQYLATSNSRLVMVQIEDVLGLSLQMNLPGTVDQHPNWRRRYTKNVKDLLASPAFTTLSLDMKERQAQV